MGKHETLHVRTGTHEPGLPDHPCRPLGAGRGRPVRLECRELPPPRRDRGHGLRLTDGRCDEYVSELFDICVVEKREAHRP